MKTMLVDKINSRDDVERGKKAKTEDIWWENLIQEEKQAMVKRRNRIKRRTRKTRLLMKIVRLVGEGSAYMLRENPYGIVIKQSFDMLIMKNNHIYAER